LINSCRKSTALPGIRHLVKIKVRAQCSGAHITCCHAKKPGKNGMYDDPRGKMSFGLEHISPEVPIARFSILRSDRTATPHVTLISRASNDAGIAYELINHIISEGSRIIPIKLELNSV